VPGKERILRGWSPCVGPSRPSIILFFVITSGESGSAVLHFYFNNIHPCLLGHPCWHRWTGAPGWMGAVHCPDIFLMVAGFALMFGLLDTSSNLLCDWLFAGNASSSCCALSAAGPAVFPGNRPLKSGKIGSRSGRCDRPISALPVWASAIANVPSLATTSRDRWRRCLGANYTGHQIPRRGGRGSREPFKRMKMIQWWDR